MLCVLNSCNDSFHNKNFHNRLGTGLPFTRIKNSKFKRSTLYTHSPCCFIYWCLRTLLPNFKNGTGLLCVEVSRGWWGHPDTVQQLPLWSIDKQLHSAPAWMVWVLGRDLALVPTPVSSKILCGTTGEKEIRAHTLLQFELIFLIKTPWILNPCLIKNEGRRIGNTTKHNFCHQLFSALSCCRSSVALIKRW